MIRLSKNDAYHYKKNGNNHISVVYLRIDQSNFLINIIIIMNKLYILFLCGWMCAVNLGAQTWDCGDQGNNLTATLDNGTLTIAGTGDMRDYNWFGAPWVSSDLFRTIIHANQELK